MKKFLLLTKLSLMVYFLLLCLLFLFFALSSCNPKIIKGDKIVLKDSNRIEWNILFVTGTLESTRNKLVNKIQENIRKYYAENGTKTEFYPVVTCSCDPNLYKITFLPIWGSGESIVRPPRDKKKLLGEGGALDIKSISVNIPIIDNNQRVTDKNKVHRLQNFKIDKSKILAIIDSGIDTSLFAGNQRFYNLMWKDPSGSTLYNFLPSQPVNDYFDGTRVKHGSAVTSIALKAMEESDRYSKLMILKALDNDNKGSIFSVSCALSYAIQKKANVINLSLGYFGAADSILYHYLQLANIQNPGVQVFAAAGNTPGNHNASRVCGGLNPANHLSGTKLFFPACFTPNLKHLISVTQLQDPALPCYYQNYSNKYISLGIINTSISNCCAMPSGFSDSRFYEGSSFATPVASGLKMRTMLKANSSIDRQSLWDGMVETTGGNQVTLRGSYIKYTPN